MKILHISTFLQGGAGRIICSLIISLKHAGHTCYLLLNDDEYEDYFNYPEFINKLNANKIKVFRVNSIFKRSYDDNLKAAKKVSELILNYDIDIIHSHTAISSFVGLMGRQVSAEYIPVIQTMHGWGNNKNSKQVNEDLKILEKVDCIVNISNSSRKLLDRFRLDAKRYELIHNGLESSLSQPESRATKIINHINNNLKNTLTIACIGSICDRKNQRCIIKALKTLVKKNITNIHLFLIGEYNKSSIIDKLKITEEVESKITLTGYIEEPIVLYSYFDLIVSASNSEGATELALIEAMMSKVATLVSDTPEHIEFYNQYNGLIFKQDDHNSLANSIESFINMSKRDRNEIIQNAYNTYNDRFSAQRMIQSYGELYYSLMELSQN